MQAKQGEGSIRGSTRSAELLSAANAEKHTDGINNTTHTKNIIFGYAKLFEEGNILDEFDKTIFKCMVRRIKVMDEKEIEIEFECGIKVKEQMK